MDDLISLFKETQVRDDLIHQTLGLVLQSGEMAAEISCLDKVLQHSAIDICDMIGYS